jgi:hypothetical protein
MATTPYQSALELARSLSGEEQSRLIRELSTQPSSEAKRIVSILDLAGLGAELWGQMDAQDYVRSERASWPD